MLRSDSSRNAEKRRRTWIRDRDRRDAATMGRVASVVRRSDELADLVSMLTRNRIGASAARDIVSRGGDTIVEIVVDPRSGLIERWSLTIQVASRGDGNPIKPAA